MPLIQYKSKIKKRERRKKEEKTPSHIVRGVSGASPTRRPSPCHSPVPPLVHPSPHRLVVGSPCRLPAVSCSSPPGVVGGRGFPRRCSPPSPSPQYRPSTLRVGARSGGGLLSLSPPVPPLSPSPSPFPVPPVVVILLLFPPRPVSSLSTPRASSFPSPSPSRCSSLPPRKQSLTAVVRGAAVGAVEVVVVVLGVLVVPVVLGVVPVVPVPIVLGVVLVVLVAPVVLGGLLVIPVVLAIVSLFLVVPVVLGIVLSFRSSWALSSSFPSSRRRSCGTWCIFVALGSLSSSSSSWASPWPLALRLHPASSCSQRWEGVPVVLGVVLVWFLVLVCPSCVVGPHPSCCPVVVPRLSPGLFHP
jgi:hypothetical protein